MSRKGIYKKYSGLSRKELVVGIRGWSCFSFRKFLIINRFEILNIKAVGRIPFYFASQTFMILARLRK
jgi:hypothetical protein